MTSNPWSYLLSCLAVSLLLLPGQGNAQQIIVNTNGERVVVFPDGSWRAYEAADSVLLRQQMQKGQVYSAEEKLEVYEDVSDNPGELLGNMANAEQYADLTLRQSRQANRTLATAQDEKFEIEGKLQQARDNMALIEPDQLGQLEDELKEKEKNVSEARSHQKKATKFAQDAQAILGMSAEKQLKALDKAMTQHQAYYSDRPNDMVFDETYIPENTEVTISSTQSSIQPKSTATVAKASTTVLFPHQDLYYAEYEREPRKCTIVANDRDAKGKVKRMVVAKGLLFKHTDDDLRPFFREEDLLTCYGQLSKVGEYVYLTFEFSVASPNAQKNFGSLAESSLLRLTLIDGTEMSLINLQGDRGRIDPYTGNTIFIGRYVLEKEQHRKLSKTELNAMRVVWSTGYEDYDIYSIDFLINQFACLNANL